MAARLTPAEKELYGPLAYQMSLRHVSAPEIARALRKQYQCTISERAVDRLLKEQCRRARERREAEQADDDLRFLAEMDTAMAGSVKKAEHPATTPASAATNWANYIIASVHKAKALGVYTERRDITSGGKELPAPQAVFILPAKDSLPDPGVPPS